MGVSLQHFYVNGERASAEGVQDIGSRVQVQAVDFERFDTGQLVKARIVVGFAYPWMVILDLIFWVVTSNLALKQLSACDDYGVVRATSAYRIRLGLPAGSEGKDGPERSPYKTTHGVTSIRTTSDHGEQRS